MLISIALSLSAAASAAHAAGPEEAKKIFNQRCTACHTFGKGVKVGPDLKGVTDRRKRDWLLKFIRSSQSVIDSGDGTAVALFQQFKQQRMPDWTDLSEEQIGAILDWFAANGPEQRPADERPAELATPADVQRGRDLFHGRLALASGGMACGSCHSIREADESVGGTYAPDLSHVYSEFRDRALTLFLKQPCTRREPDSSAAAFLTPEESFSLKAYLWQTALPSGASAGAVGAAAATRPVQPTPPPAAGAAGVVRRRPAAPSLRSEALFRYGPYAALLILVIGLGLRHTLARRRMDQVRAGAHEAWRVLGGSSLWRIGLAATAIAHVGGLLLPRAILAWNGVPLRLYVLEATGFLFGLLALVGWARVMWRHLGRRGDSHLARATEVCDCVFLSLFFAAVASGLLTAGLYRWGSSWSAGTLAPYLASVARGTPALELIAQMPFLVKLHALTLFALLAALPFTSAALIPVAAADRALSLAARPLAAPARAARALAARLSPARWLWPEEDLADLAGEAVPVVETVASEVQPDRSGMVYQPDSNNPRART